MYSFLIMLLLTSFPLCAELTVTRKPIAENQEQLSIIIPVSETEWLYKDFIDVASDDPTITIKSLHIDGESSNQYDPAFKATKAVYRGPITLQVAVEISSPTANTSAALHVTYLKNNQTAPTQEIIPLLPNFLECAVRFE